MPGDPTGAMVVSVTRHSLADGLVRPGDVLGGGGGLSRRFARVPVILVMVS